MQDVEPLVQWNTKGVEWNMGYMRPRNANLREEKNWENDKPDSVIGQSFL